MLRWRDGGIEQPIYPKVQKLGSEAFRRNVKRGIPTLHPSITDGWQAGSWPK
jgi:hypothetical protein